MNGVRQQDRRASFSGCTRASPKLKETAWIIGELTDPIQLAQQCINSADQVDEHCAASLRLNTARLWPPAGSTIRSCRDADWGHARQTADCLVEQDHHVLMRRPRGVIQRHEALSSCDQPAPCEEWCVGWYLLGDQTSKPLFRTVGHLEAAAPTCQRQRGHKAMAVPVLEAALHPRITVGNSAASICQQLDVAKRCLIRGVKWHVSTRRSHCLNDTTRMA
jgi:hypothetical protein